MNYNDSKHDLDELSKYDFFENWDRLIDPGSKAATIVGYACQCYFADTNSQTGVFFLNTASRLIDLAINSKLCEKGRASVAYPLNKAVLQRVACWVKHLSSHKVDTEEWLESAQTLRLWIEQLASTQDMVFDSITQAQITSIARLYFLGKRPDRVIDLNSSLPDTILWKSDEFAMWVQVAEVLIQGSLLPTYLETKIFDRWSTVQTPISRRFDEFDFPFLCVLEWASLVSSMSTADSFGDLLPPHLLYDFVRSVGS
ncbi:MAG: hypothetical protein AAGB29_07925 [Planctomycetota bacterium]